MAVKSNRDFIAKCEEYGELVRVTEEVDWDEELSAIARRLCEIHGPAALFENIKDYPGHRCLGAPLAENRRFAIAMGLDPNTSFQELRKTYDKRVNNLIKPMLVSKGPCKENFIAEKDVDIFNFPIPMVHDGDGGRYVGTWAFEVTKDPESDWTNYGIYRVMVYDEQHLAGLFTPSKHIGQHIAKYVKKGENLPVAIVVGGDPLTTLMASFDAPVGVNEIDCAGGLLQAPIEVVKCECSDLLVPAESEIVIEGELMINVTVPEGPFGEFTGYRSGSGMRNLIKIKAITHRNNPIFTVSNMGIPFHESSLRGISRSLTYEKFFRSLGIPVTNCHIPPEFSEQVLVVGVKTTTHTDMAVRVKNAFSAWRPSVMHKVIVVDEDVDVFNMNEVLHAFATKCHPIRGIKTYEEHILHLCPALSVEERRTGKGAAVLFDCTWPSYWPLEERPPKISFSTYPQDLVEKITNKWTKYGFKA